MIALAILAQLLYPPSVDSPIMPPQVPPEWVQPGSGSRAPFINVKAAPYFACGDGVCDDTAAIQAAVNSGGTGPVVVEMPQTSGGYKLSSVLTLAKNSTLRIRGNMTVTTAGILVPDSLTDNTGQSGIECPEGARIKLANSANVDLIANTNFATLSGTGNKFGTFKFLLSGCILDGNKANQTALVSTTTGTITNVARSAGGVVTITMSGATTPTIATGMTVNIDGLTNDNFSFNGRFIAQSGGNPFTYNQTLRNTVASTGATGASPTAKGFSGSNGVRIYGRAGRFKYLTIANNVLDGIWHEGYTPTAFTDDSTELETLFFSVRTMNSGGNGETFWGPQMTRHIDSVSFNHGQWGRECFQSFVDTHMVSYLNTSGSLHVGQGCAVQASGSQESAASGWAILLDSGSAPSVFSSGVAACVGCVGIEMRSPNHIYQGLVQNNTTGVKFNGGSGMLTISMTGNTTWFDCTSEIGRVRIDLMSSDAAGTMKGSGCWAGTERLDLPILAGNTTLLQAGSPSSGFFIGGWNPVFPGSNGTLMVPDIAQTMTANFTLRPLLLANLGTPANGTITYCSDCTIANPCAGGGNGAFAQRINGAWVCDGGPASAGFEHDFCAYNAANLAGATAFARSAATNASTLTADSTITQDIAGAGTGTFVAKLCSDGVTCAGGNVYLTCTAGANCATAAAGRIDACTVTKAAVPAGTTLTWSVATACGTTDPGINACAHFTTP